MLGARTRQVNSYGRRGQRIVSVSESDTRQPTRLQETAGKPPGSHCDFIDSDSEEEVVLLPPPKKKSTAKHIILSSSPSPKTHHAHRRKPIAFKSTSVTRRRETLDLPADVDPKGPQKRFETNPAPAPAAQPRRQPLGVLPSNIPSSASNALGQAKPSKPAGEKKKALQPSSSLVYVDIVVYDHAGKRVRQERRVSKPGVQTNPVQKASKEIHSKLSTGSSRETAIFILDDDIESTTRSRPPRRENKRDPDLAATPRQPELELPSFSTQPINSDTLPKPTRPPGNVRRNVIISPASTPETSFTGSKAPAHSPLPHVAQPRQRPPVPTSPVQAPRTKPRRLTPIRHRLPRTTSFPVPPSPTASINTDLSLELELDLAKLGLSPSAHEELGPSEKPPPAYLLPLLQGCSQSTPHEFSAFIDMFPLDPIVHTVHGDRSAGLVRFQKIGEASYSEVFGIGEVVLKVIPLRDEENSSFDDDDDFPALSDAKDVLKEMIVTQAMGEMCEGFVKLLRTYIVRGKYPSLLLDLWDEYHERKGSESVRPDGFSVSQTYAIIVLPNGGPDLEAYNFALSSQTRWGKACSIFWQVARSLADAESLVRFEHRDLHWGQILVKDIPANVGSKPSKNKRVPMDHDSHGVKATVIDLGLARMNADSPDGELVRWTPLEDEIFEGEGDYQFDVYRMMKVHNKGKWQAYCPLTNVMWLHYLAFKLLRGKRLRAPSASRKSTAVNSLSFGELECYKCLVELEEILGAAVANCKAQATGKKGRRKTQAVKAAPPPVGPQCAGDVLQFGIDQGWIS